MRNNFVDSVKMDVSKCLGFALAFLSPADLCQILISTCDKFLSESNAKDVN